MARVGHCCCCCCCCHQDEGDRGRETEADEEMPCPVVLVVDGATQFLAEASVCFGVIKVKTSETMEFELIESETQFPGDVCPADGEGIIVWLNEGHGIVVK